MVKILELCLWKKIKENNIICLHDSDIKKSCEECEYCFKNKSGNVIFKNR